MTDKQKYFLEDIKGKASGIIELTSNRIKEIQIIGNFTTEKAVLKSICSDMIDIKECVKYISEDDHFADTSKMVPSKDLCYKFANLYDAWKCDPSGEDETFDEYVKEHWNDEND